MSTLPPELSGSWDIDSVHSTVGFSVKHAMVATTRGHFAGFTGGAVIDAAAPENSTLWLEIDATTIQTGNADRDAHLRSNDFFGSDDHPKLTYRSTSVKVDGDEIRTVGDLTIKGISHAVELTWTFNGIAMDPFGNTKTGFDGEGSLSRKDWDLTWNAPLETGGVLVSDKVKLVLEIEAARQA